MWTTKNLWVFVIGLSFILGFPGNSAGQVGWGSAGPQTVGAAPDTSGLQKPVPMTGHPQPPPWAAYTGWEFVLPHPGTDWHAGYYHPAWGLPVALVVPPRARFSAEYGWGVGGTRSDFIAHQFSRNYPGPRQIFRQGLRPAPRWIFDTSQFGVYAVRGPW